MDDWLGLHLRVPMLPLLQIVPAIGLLQDELSCSLIPCLGSLKFSPVKFLPYPQGHIRLSSVEECASVYVNSATYSSSVGMVHNFILRLLMPYYEGWQSQIFKIPFQDCVFKAGVFSSFFKVFGHFQKQVSLTYFSHSKGSGAFKMWKPSPVQLEIRFYF